MITVIFCAIILFYSIVFHEIAHGYAAYRNGDMTAFNAGRLTLNPIKHLDFLGSIIVPIISYKVFGFAFGWAKPVPYNPNNLKDKKYGELQVASAGVITNFFIAFVSVVIFYIIKHYYFVSPDLKDILMFISTVNIFLGLFNLLPFPPADGFSIFSELTSLSRNLFLSIRNLFSNKKIYKPEYKGDNSNIRNWSFYIKSLFSNPFMMIGIIFVAVQVFALLVPYILSFINFLFSF
ncbi:MAG: site-2 protease family protein [Candidatus Nomurabacteria bacterium]